MKKILLLSLSNKFGEEIGVKLTHDLNVFYLNIDGFIEYSLLDSEKMLLTCGQKYYIEREQQALKTCLAFENMFFFCSYDVFVNNEQFFQNFEKLYLALPLEELKKYDDSDLVINTLAFEERDAYLKEIAKEIKFLPENSAQSYNKLKVEIQKLL